ncbi:hypothetical protein BC332_30649 [Capsicum chinense]|nr:hypothetical protein BC332_30649 [Capsicum chinense]
MIYSSVATDYSSIEQCNGATDLTGDLVVKSVMGKSFDAFRKILREQKLDSYFRKSYFGQYLDLSEDNNARFQIKIVYDLLKHRFIYENKDKIDEAWEFEAILYLREQVNYQEEVSCPRILRWLSVKPDKNAKFLDLFNPPKEAIVHLWLVPTNRELKMSFFLSLRSIQNLSDPKVIDGIKMELFGATTIIKITILEGGVIAVDNGSRIGSGSGVAIGANDAPFTVFETSHYDYNHKSCTVFSPNFSTSSEYSSCKCQDCKVKHDEMINVINALTAPIKEMTSKRGFIPSKRISYPYTPLEIKVSKRRMKDTSKASSSIKKKKNCNASVFVLHRCSVYKGHRRATLAEGVEATTEEHNITVDNPSTASKEKQKWSLYCQHQPKVFRNEECLINIIKGFSIPASLPWDLVDEVYIPINCGNEFYWVLAIVIVKERHIRVYESMSRRRFSGPSSEIQKLAKILPTYIDMSGFLD